MTTQCDNENIAKIETITAKLYNKQHLNSQDIFYQIATKSFRHFAIGCVLNGTAFMSISANLDVLEFMTDY